MRGRLKFSFRVTRAEVVLAALLVVLLVGIVRGSSIPRASEPLNSSSIFCKSTSEISSCPAVTAVAKSTTSERQVSQFLVDLWNDNASGGPPLVGRFGLLRCENPGPSPYRVTCVVSSAETGQQTSLLKGVFNSSRLFQSVRLTTAHLSI